MRCSDRAAISTIGEIPCNRGVDYSTCGLFGPLASVSFTSLLITSVEDEVVVPIGVWLEREKWGVKEADCYFEDIFIRKLAQEGQICDLSFLLFLCHEKKKFNP